MTNNILHILFLPRWYPNRYDPMPGLFIRRHAEAASKHVHISVVYVHPCSEKIDGYQTVQTFEPQLHTVQVYYTQSDVKPLNLWKFFIANYKGLRLIRQRSGLPDLIHVHVLTRLAIIALWMKFYYGIPYIVTEHWSRYIKVRDEFGGFWRKLFTRWVVEKAAMVTTVTHNLAAAMQSHGLRNNDYRILPNVVDTNKFCITDKKPDSVKRLIHVSCFEDRSKNISGLLRALKKLSDFRQDFECIMIGDGMDFDAMRSLSKALDLDGIVHFTGLLEGQKLAQMLSSGHFLVLFSNYENLPVVIPEALACGLPVVASKVGGIAEVIGEENGILVEPGNETELTASMNTMLNQHMKYNPDKLRRTVVEKNSPEQVGKLLFSWYSELLTRRAH